MSLRALYMLEILLYLFDCEHKTIWPVHNFGSHYRWLKDRIFVLLPPANVVCEGYVFTRVCHSFCSRGGWSTWQGTPPRADTPRDQVHPPGPGTSPWTRYTPWSRHPPDQIHPSPPGPGTPPRADTPSPRDQVPPDQVHTPLGPGTPPWDQVHPPEQTPPQTRYTPLGTRYSPPEQSMLGGTVNVRVVRILLECNLVHSCFLIHIRTSWHHCIREIRNRCNAWLLYWMFYLQELKSISGVTPA